MAILRGAFVFTHSYASHADIIPAGEVPCKGKFTALFGFNFIYHAQLRMTVIEDAGAVAVLGQRKTSSVAAKSGVFSRKIIGLHAQECGNLIQFVFGYSHVAFPETAVAAAGAFELIFICHCKY